MSTYAGTCNPPRKVKAAPAPVDADGFDDQDDIPQPQPAKRGRKAGNLSRSARETQRKLNHSIIEKARRTKINEALATLKQLVPADFEMQKNPGGHGDDGDDEYLDSRSSSKQPGKKDEKEKEFKLEILVRTVGYMQVLLERNATLEATAAAAGASGSTRCPDPNIHTNSSKRKRSMLDDHGDTSTKDSPRLPPISSWLHHTDLSISSPKHSSLQLPSPPASTHFSPVMSHQLPPALRLPPMHAAESLALPRTSDEEFAATLLLQMSAPKVSRRPVVAQTPGSLLGL